jgi:hypothetical protein
VKLKVKEKVKVWAAGVAVNGFLRLDADLSRQPVDPARR